MENLWMALSKYFMLVLMSVFILLSFFVMRKQSKSKRNALLKAQNIIMFIIHAVAYLVIYINQPTDTIIIFYGAQVVYFILVIGLYSVFYDNINKVLINNMCMFLCVSFIMLTRIKLSMSINQFKIVVIATVITMMIPYCMNKFAFLKNLTWVYGVAGMGLLAFVLVLGQTSYGAKLAIDLGFFSIQPSEFVKITYVFFLAAMFERSTSFKNIAVSAVFAGIHVIVLVLSKDLGSGLIFFLVYVFMVYSATCHAFYLAAGLGFGGGASVVAYKLFYHVQERVIAWRDPWSVIDDAGYQVTQSLFAIGTGGWLGMGLYQGLPTSIPVVSQDFIFSAISEELGGYFALAIIFLCFSCFAIFMQVAIHQKTMFFKMIAVGLGITYAVQVVLTIGGAIKFIPSTGVTLPFISYGGSSMLSTMVLFAVVQGLSIASDNESEKFKKMPSKRLKADARIVGRNIGKVQESLYEYPMYSQEKINHPSMHTIPEREEKNQGKGRTKNTQSSSHGQGKKKEGNHSRKTAGKNNKNTSEARNSNNQKNTRSSNHTKSVKNINSTKRKRGE